MFLSFFTEGMLEVPFLYNIRCTGRKQEGVVSINRRFRRSGTRLDTSPVCIFFFFGMGLSFLTSVSSVGLIAAVFNPNLLYLLF